MSESESISPSVFAGQADSWLRRHQNDMDVIRGLGRRLAVISLNIGNALDSIELVLGCDEATDADRPPGIVRGPGWVAALAESNGNRASKFEILGGELRDVRCGGANNLVELGDVARLLMEYTPAVYDVSFEGEPWGKMDVSRSSYRVVGDGGKTTLVPGAIII